MGSLGQTEPPTAQVASPSRVNEARDTWLSYYGLQYARIAQHENTRLQISGSVLSASVVALGLTAVATKGALRAFAIIFFAVAAVNVFAILNAEISRHWVSIHQSRAEHALSKLDDELLNLHRSVYESTRPEGRGPYRRAAMSILRLGISGAGPRDHQATILMFTHAVIALMSIALGIAWILR